MGRSSHLYRVRESNNSCLRVSPLPGQSLFNVKTLGAAQSLGSESGKGSALHPPPPAFAALQAPSFPISLLNSPLERGETEEKRQIRGIF